MATSRDGTPVETTPFEAARNPDRRGPNIFDVDGMDELLARMEDCETVRDWSFLLNDYIQWGNNTKVGKRVAIFNLGAAHDCPNRWTERCQVDGDECYAVVDEKIYDYVLAYFRRQEFLWDCLDADTWAEAFLAIVDRKYLDGPFFVKFSQAGDVRHQGDIVKMDRIAERVGHHGISVFTYSASSHLDWSEAEHVVVNRSNDLADYGDQRYVAVESESDISDDAVHCPFDRQKRRGVPQEERIKCGECRACIDRKAPDVGVVK